MNTVQELTEYGFSESTARVMLESYEKRIGEIHGCNRITDITYTGGGGRDVELTCTLCGAVYHRVFASTTKWSELRRTCSCQTQPKETLPKAGVVRNDDPSYIGKVYGDFEVIEAYGVPHSTKSGSTIMWMCRCVHCGKVSKGHRPSEIRRGKKCQCQIEAERKAIWDAEIGRRYGRLTVIGIEHRMSGRKSKGYAVCDCDCGGRITVQVDNLRSGATKSCGCIQDELIKKARGSRNEARSKSPLYSTWSGMKARCFNRKNTAYKDYGGRGIIVCPDWLGPEGFDRFEKWAFENGYEPETGVSLDRIDVNGNYEPDNCRFASRFVQAVNQRPRSAKRKPVKTYSIDGEDKTLRQWCREYHISVEAVQYRISKLGMSMEDAIKTPKTRKGNAFAAGRSRKQVADINKCESYIEANLYLASIRNHVSLVPQFQIENYRADFLVEGTDFVVECDGFDYHKTPEQIAKDYERERCFLKHGYRVIRFSGSEINKDSDACCREITSIIEANHEPYRQTHAG